MKINILLTFALAVCNLEVIRSFLATADVTAEAAKQPRARAPVRPGPDAGELIGRFRHQP
jgi:hypothetical protein